MIFVSPDTLLLYHIYFVNYNVSFEPFTIDKPINPTLTTNFLSIKSLKKNESLFVYITV